MLPWLIPAAIVLAGLLLWWRRHHRFVTLNWPPQHPNVFIMSCQAYFRRLGWEVRERDRGPADFVIEASGKKALIFCRGRGFALSPILVDELNRTHNALGTDVFVICYEKTDRPTLANLTGPLIMHYTEIRELMPPADKPSDLMRR